MNGWTIGDYDDMSPKGDEALHPQDRALGQRSRVTGALCPAKLKTRIWAPGYKAIATLLTILWLVGMSFGVRLIWRTECDEDGEVTGCA